MILPCIGLPWFSTLNPICPLLAPSSDESVAHWLRAVCPELGMVKPDGLKAGTLGLKTDELVFIMLKAPVCFPMFFG